MAPDLLLRHPFKITQVSVHLTMAMINFWLLSGSSGGTFRR